MTSKRKLFKLLGLSLVVLALAIPSVASAQPVGETLGTYQSGPAVDPVVIESASSSSGFDWGDATIGAAAAIALLVIAIGGALLVRDLRADRHRIRVTG
jgi:uncharacterized protein YwlG (UPF0340 family)